MANILCVGPQENDGRHDALVEKLKRDNHNVLYLDDALGLFGAFQANRYKTEFASKEVFETSGGIEADVVLYDAGLLYDKRPSPDRAAQFRPTGIESGLKSFKVPVIVFTGKDESEHYKKPLSNAGFTQINHPYDVEKVIEMINQALSKK